MNKTFLRIVALLLVQCLVADPAKAFVLNNPLAPLGGRGRRGDQECRVRGLISPAFERQALMLRLVSSPPRSVRVIAMATALLVMPGTMATQGQTLSQGAASALREYAHALPGSPEQTRAERKILEIAKSSGGSSAILDASENSRDATLHSAALRWATETLADSLENGRAVSQTALRLSRLSEEDAWPNLIARLFVQELSELGQSTTNPQALRARAHGFIVNILKDLSPKDQAKMSKVIAQTVPLMRNGADAKALSFLNEILAVPDISRQITAPAQNPAPSRQRRPSPKLKGLVPFIAVIGALTAAASVGWCQGPEAYHAALASAHGFSWGWAMIVGSPLIFPLLGAYQVNTQERPSSELEPALIFRRLLGHSKRLVVVERAKGWSLKQIVAKLHLNKPTVQYHLGQVGKWLGIQGSSEIQTRAKLLWVLYQLDVVFEPPNQPDLFGLIMAIQEVVDGLTPRPREVFTKGMEGNRTLMDISEQLGISSKGVENHTYAFNRQLWENPKVQNLARSLGYQPDFWLSTALLAPRYLEFHEEMVVRLRELANQKRRELLAQIKARKLPTFKTFKRLIEQLPGPLGEGALTSAMAAQLLDISGHAAPQRLQRLEQHGYLRASVRRPYVYGLGPLGKKYLKSKNSEPDSDPTKNVEGIEIEHSSIDTLSGVEAFSIARAMYHLKNNEFLSAGRILQEIPHEQVSSLGVLLSNLLGQLYIEWALFSDEPEYFVKGEEHVRAALDAIAVLRKTEKGSAQLEQEADCANSLLVRIAA